MTDLEVTVFLYQKDFTERSGDRYFLYASDVVTEISVQQLVKHKGWLVTHDFWLIAPSIQKSTGKIPTQVLDIFDLQRLISGLRSLGRTIERSDFKSALEHLLAVEHDVASYISIYLGRSPVEINSYSAMASALSATWEALIEKAGHEGELRRYLDIEIHVSSYLWRCAAKGIKLDLTKLRQHKNNVNTEYYLALKDFGTKFNKAYEMPRDSAIEEHLISQGFDLSDASIDYVLEFLPFADGYGKELRKLRKISKSRGILSDMPFSCGRAFPMIDVFGTITSRIIYKNPSVQNLAKRYRDIFIPDKGMKLGYIDYAQFEVGVMTFLSEDVEMKALYDTGDLYTEASKAIFQTPDRRKEAKRLCLSYAYGMPLKKISDAAAAEGANRSDATKFFKRFTIFDNWRKLVANQYFADGRIGTSVGNYLKRVSDGALSAKDERSCVSQVVQGTASLIFKKALIEVSKKLPKLQVLIPMHDAIFFQYPTNYELETVKRIFEEVFLEHFEGRLAAQASLGSFFQGEIKQV